MCVQIDVIVLGTMMQQFPITVLKGESYISISLSRLCVVWPMPLVGKAGFDFHVDEIMSFLRVCGQLTSSWEVELGMQSLELPVEVGLPSAEWPSLPY